MTPKRNLLSLLVFLCTFPTVLLSFQEDTLFNGPLAKTISLSQPIYSIQELGNITSEDTYDSDREVTAAMELIDHEINSFEESDQLGAPVSSPKVVNVETHGARSHGRDNSEAFQRAWEDACTNAPSIFLVPKNKNYRLKPMTLSGPCRSNVKVLIQGTLVASHRIKDWKDNERTHWILFNNIQGLNIQGGGIVNGNGRRWWKRSCKIDKSRPCRRAPTAMLFYSCKNLVVKNLRIKNSPQIQVSFQKCSNVQASNLMIFAPKDSPNTDGIHVTDTQFITINNCVIGTGDDCISIVSGSKNVKATGITCGPGHGISIGSLGKGNSEAHVSEVSVDGAKIIGATNGVRIKTWQGGSGSVNNVLFNNIFMKNVTRPIIIDQNYCDSTKPCPEQGSAVKISNVVYKNIKGTSASKIAIALDCSKSAPCEGICMQDINLAGAVLGETVKSNCANAKGSTKGNIVPPACF